MDGDDIPNAQDPDADGDGILNEFDAEPYGPGSTRDPAFADLPITYVVEINRDKYVSGYSPKGMHIRPGDTVRWAVTDDYTHTVTSDDDGDGLWSADDGALFSSGPITKWRNNEFEYTFEDVGKYHYYSRPFLTVGMKDVITVGFFNEGNFPFPSDVNPYSNLGRAVRELLKRGIIQLGSDGMFHGNERISRAEAAHMLLLAAGYHVSPVQNDGVFPDLSPGSEEELFAMSAVAHAIMQGYPDGTFRPLRTVNHAEFLKMVSSAFRLEQYLPHSYIDVQPCAWYTPFVGVADTYVFFLYDQIFFTPDLLMIRREAVWAVYQVLMAKEVGQYKP